MVKKSVGLPDGFDLRVTSEDLMGKPARLSGYLDPAPIIVREPQQVQKFEPIMRDTQEGLSVQRIETIIDRDTQSLAPRAVPQTKEIGIPQRKIQKPVKVQRLHMNVTPDIERKALELMEILSHQSPDRRVKITEVMQALLILLYDARDDINERLPERGRWGSPTAKSIPTELAKVFKQALRASWSKSIDNSFKAVVGE